MDDSRWAVSARPSALCSTTPARSSPGNWRRAAPPYESWHLLVDQNGEVGCTRRHGRAGTFEIAGARHRIVRLRHSCGNDHPGKTGQLEPRAHSHAVVELELERQILHLYFGNSKRHLGSLRRACKDE